MIIALCKRAKSTEIHWLAIYGDVVPPRRLKTTLGERETSEILGSTGGKA